MIQIDAGEFFLIEPNEVFAEQISEDKQDFLDAACPMNGCGPLPSCEDSITFISECQKYTTPETLPENCVLATQFLFVRKSDRCVVGMIQIRHDFNEYLSRFGGHIGYSIRPKERRKGYATAMLHAVLPYCKQIGLDQVLITCSEGNIASEKTILNNGGIYESTVIEPDENHRLKRLWIKL